MCSVVCPSSTRNRQYSATACIAWSVWFSPSLISSFFPFFLFCIFPSIPQCEIQMNPQLTKTQTARVNTWTHSRPSPMSAMQAPFASVYNPLQAQTSELPQRRHSTSSVPSQVRVGPEQLKCAAQVCPNSPVEVEVPGLKVLHVQFNSPLQLYSQSNIMDSLQGQISSVSPDFPR